MNFAIGTLLMCHLLVSQSDGTKKDLKLVGKLIEKTKVTQYIDDSKNNETYETEKEKLYVQGMIGDEEYFINVSKTACRPIMTEEERIKNEKERQYKNKKIAEAKEYNETIDKENESKLAPKGKGSKSGVNPIAFKKGILLEVNKALSETPKKEEISEDDLKKSELPKKEEVNKEELKKDNSSPNDIDDELESLGL